MIMRPSGLGHTSDRHGEVTGGVREPCWMLDDDGMPATPVVVLLGTLDTKGPEHAYVRDRLREAGVEVTLVDVGILGAPTVEPDISAHAVARAAGTSLEELRMAGWLPGTGPSRSRRWPAAPRRWWPSGDARDAVTVSWASVGAAARPSSQPCCAPCPSASPSSSSRR